MGNKGLLDSYVCSVVRDVMMEGDGSLILCL